MELLPPTAEVTETVVVQKQPPATNSYASKKAIAQRMADLALLTSNASQLRYILQYARGSPTFGVAVSLIALSLILQVAVGIFLIFKMKRFKNAEEKEQANSYVVAGVFLITIVNVLVGAFSFEDEKKKDDGDSEMGNRFGNITESIG